LGDFVIMPNHVHLLITPVADDSAGTAPGADVERNSIRYQNDAMERNSFPFVKLEQILKSIKGSSAVACNRLLRRSGALWQVDSYDHIVRSLEQLSAYREYIAQNPRMAGIDLRAEALYRADWMDAWLRGP
jgi:type I restriction enzyme R subunit